MFTIDRQNHVKMGPGQLAALGPSGATLWPLKKGAWALVKSTQEALVTPWLPGASQLAFPADVARSVEVRHGS